MRTDDPTKKRNPEAGVIVDQVVNIRGVRLNSEAHVCDLLTLKILVLEKLRGQYISDKVTATKLIDITLARYGLSDGVQASEWEP